MRARRTAVAVLVCLLAALRLDAQTVSPQSANSSSVQAAAALNNAIAALSRNSTITDITLTGTAEWIAGSDDETGTAAYKALATGNRLDLNLSNGVRSEVRSFGAPAPSGSWVGPDGVTHPIAYHNLLIDPGLFPLFPLSTISSSSNAILSLVGLESRNGSSVVHLTAAQSPPAAVAANAALFQHLSAVDIYLDASSYLPVAYTFTVHPDDNELLDIPVEISYSNYQTIGGAQIPLHVQRFVNNTLVIDLQFQSAVVNSGLSKTAFSLP